MKIKELIYQTPEMTEDKLLEIIDEELLNLKHSIKKEIFDNLHYLKEYRKKGVDSTEFPNHSIEAQCILKEFDLIQDKKSGLTKSRRDFVTGLVGACLIKMTKGKDGGESTSNDRLEPIPEIEEVGDNSES